MATTPQSPSRLAPPSTRLASSPNQRHNLFELWHLLSLDAATVAAVWTWFVAAANHIVLPAVSITAIFLAVWTLYAADRLLDAHQLSANPLHTAGLEARHLFHHRHSGAFLTGIALASTALAALLHLLLPKALELYAILGVLLFAWLLLIHARSSNHDLPKEIAVGIFFPAATFIPTVSRLPQVRFTMLPYAALFAAVCCLNCLFIHAWEHHEPAIPELTPNAHWSTRYATRHLTAFTLITALAGVILAYASRHTAHWPLALAASLGTLILLALHRIHHRLPRVTLRAAADFALLTPLLFIARHPLIR